MWCRCTSNEWQLETIIESLTNGIRIVNCVLIDSSFFNFHLQLSDRNLTSIDYDHGGTDGNNLFKNDDHLTAFGLALMQNGFQPHSAILNSHTFQQINKQQQLTNSTSSTTNLNNAMSSGANANAINHSNAASVETSEQKWTPQNQTDDLNAWNVKSNSYQNTQKPFK